ncbi:MAG: hypothetical protein mread185_000075 [Mycoplasmataceae bacterium]|nr:MAG: hypothetical protein mread185_000075 [Mycoplasmataceae bacterium]
MSNLNPDKLEELNLSDNNFHPNDLSDFENFHNLKRLEIGNENEERIKDGYYNRFYGSLKYLWNMHRLNYLSIDETDIDSGLEYLYTEDDTTSYSWTIPHRFSLYCYSEYRPESKVNNLRNQLKNYRDDYETHSIKKWKEDHPESVYQAQKSIAKKKEKQQLRKNVEEQAIKIKNLELKLTNQGELIKNLEEKCFNHEQRIDKLEKQLKIEQTEKKTLEEKLIPQLKKGRDDLNELLTKYKNNKDLFNWLEMMLQTKAEITNNSNNIFAHKQLAIIKEKISKNLNAGEINSLLNKQKEIIELEQQLDKLQIQETRIEILPK